MSNEPEEQEEEDTLIPEYIELTDEERAEVENIQNPDSFGCSIDLITSIIEKLVAHIEKQNDQLTKLALSMVKP